MDTTDAERRKAPTKRILTRAAAAAVAVLATVASSALFSSTASATDYSYCSGTWVAPNSWCSSPEIHTFGYNRVLLVSGANLCAKLTAPNDPDSFYARKCENGILVAVTSDGGGRAPYPNNSVSMRAHIANGANASSWPLYGFATY